MTTQREIESELRRWLRAHYGVIGYRQALALGASERLIRRKVARGEWELVFRGVYRDTAIPPTHYQALEAAIVASGHCAVASHRSAAWIWELIPEPPRQPELTVPRGKRDVRLAGVVIHTSTDLNVSKPSERHHIPVTNPLRTLVDLAGCVTPAELTEAVDKGVARRLVTPAGLEAELRRLARPGRLGIEALRRHLLERGFIGEPAPSVLESKMRRIIVSLGLPLPAVEVRVGQGGRYRLDVAWAKIFLAVEVDGFTYHSSPESKRYDEERRGVLRRQGWHIEVFDWRQVCREPHKVAIQIAAIYAERTAAQ